MSQQKDNIDIAASAWAGPLSLTFRHALEKAKKVQPSLVEASGRHEMKPAGMRIDKNQKAEARAESPPQPPTEIDVEAVARKVYRLMQADLILEKERMRRPGG
jgi:hypothetical protein